MKILQITPEAPSKLSGGGLGVYQTLLSLKGNNYFVTYVGPMIEDKDIEKLYDELYILDRTKNPIKRAVNLLNRISNSMYNYWKKLDLDFNKFDFIVMDFTKLDYVLSNIGSNKLIVKAHNVEYDYSKNDYLKDKTFKKYIVSKLSYKQEKNILYRANRIILLTLNDANRIVDIYGKENIYEKIEINPVSLEGKKNNFYKKRDDTFNLLITGSLWYKENTNGVIWFIENILTNLSFNVNLIVAGSRPTKSLANKIKKYNNVNLVDTPRDMEEYFINCDMVVAPIFMGAGMKVKIAEAFSYGKPVIGTTHAFIGYEVENRVNSFVADSKEEFIAQLTYAYNLSNIEWEKLCLNVNTLFNNKYEIRNSVEQWKKIIEG